MSIRSAVHWSITLLLGVALCAVILFWVRDHTAAEGRLQSKTEENAALRKRADTAEVNTRLVIERFAEAMKGMANEAGHLSGRSFARHEKSFVQVYSFYRRRGEEMATAGTACYLGDGYFLTAKHVVVQEPEPGGKRPDTTKIEVRVNGEMVRARLVDNGAMPQPDQVDVEDWAVLTVAKPPAGLIPIKPLPGYSFKFGERLVRYGNDSNRGIAPAAGYVAQVSDAGWISWLVDSLPGCSGGGVMNDRDQVVGLNGGYLDGSTRLAVIIPIRKEMFRRLPEKVLTTIGERPN